MKIILISQVNPEGLARGEIFRLLASLDGVPDLTLYLVTHDLGADAIKRIKEAVDDLDLRIVALPQRRSLAASRNTGLEAAAPDLKADDTVVGFPDDDARFPPGFFPQLRTPDAAASHDVVATAMGPSPDEPATFYPRTPRPLSVEDAVSIVSSNTLFVSGRVVRALGGFDCRFGLGAPLNSAEDLDFAIRAVRTGHPAIFQPGLVVDHPIKPGDRARYYRGNLAVLLKHRDVSRHVHRSALLRVASGVRMVLRRQKKPRQLLKDWATIAHQLRKRA